MRSKCHNHEVGGKFPGPQCPEHWVSCKKWPTPLCFEHMEEWSQAGHVDHKWEIPKRASETND
jgi:hypothetical protein